MATTKSQALSVVNVSKRYPASSWFGLRASNSAKLALQNVSFDIHEGETVGLLGPNGAGKTTLLRVITTLLYPDEGQILLRGESVLGRARAMRGRMGLVTCDDRSFYWRLTGRQNLHFFGALYGVAAPTLRHRIDELLDTVGLSAAADIQYQNYSSGMKQKMAVIRGLLSNPDLVLYDEPTRSLDPLSASNIRRWLVANRGRNPRQAHLLATNQLDEAEQLCDRVIIISQGKLIAQGTVPEIHRLWDRSDFSSHVLTCSGPAPLLKRDPDIGILAVEVLDGPVSIYQIRVRSAKGSTGLSEAIRQILASSAELLDCRSEQVAFDEVFCSLILNHLADVESLPEAVAAR